MMLLSYVTIFQTISAAFFAIFSIMLMAVILLQRGRGVGLAGAFGGAGGAATFGAKTGDILTWVTMIMFGIYVLLAIILNYVFVPATPSLGASISSTTPAGATSEAPPAAAPVEPVPAESTPAAPAPTPAPADSTEGAAAPSEEEAAPPATAPAQGFHMRSLYEQIRDLPIFGQQPTA